MTTRSSPAPIVFTTMISNVAARSTGRSQIARTPASMPPRPARPSREAPPSEVPSPDASCWGAPPLAGVFVSAVVTAAITKEPAVTRKPLHAPMAPALRCARPAMAR